MKHTYKFSIITSIYNTESYLEEMIESIISQDIGFENNVQLILINDGSTDGSYEICKYYKEKYINNIEVVNLNHMGVSHARNKGIELATGKYINFLDSDDKLESNVLKCVYDFFEENYKEIDLVAIPLYFFDKECGEHILNYKFKSEDIVDICDKYNFIQLSASSTFIKLDVLEKFRFNEKLSYAEDAEIITKVILEKGKYAVLKNVKYYYRRRKSNDSATQNYNMIDWYLNYIINFSCKMIDELNGKYKDYVQFLVLYDLQWRINNIGKNKMKLGEENMYEFFKKLKYVLNKIGYKIIFKQKNIRLRKKIILIILKKFNNKLINRLFINLLINI